MTKLIDKPIVRKIEYYNIHEVFNVHLYKTESGVSK